MTLEVVLFLQSLRNVVLDFLFQTISFLGEEVFYIAILAFVYFAIDKKKGEIIAYTLFVSALVNSSIKYLFKWQRPFVKYPDQVANLRPQTSHGYSFPSGHTQNASSLWFSIAFILKKKTVYIGVIVFVVLMGLSRMYLGVHFLEDVLVGGALGLLIAYLVHLLYTKYEQLIGRVQILLLVLFLVLAIIYNTEGYYKSYGLLLGFTVAIPFEHKYVNFNTNINHLQKVIRVISVLIVMIALRFILSFAFDLVVSEGSQLSIVLDGLRYAIVGFVGFGVYPLLFKKLDSLGGRK